jgi:hypothetical protein
MEGVASLSKTLALEGEVGQQTVVHKIWTSDCNSG